MRTGSFWRAFCGMPYRLGNVQSAIEYCFIDLLKQHIIEGIMSFKKLKVLVFPFLLWTLLS